MLKEPSPGRASRKPSKTFLYLFSALIVLQIITMWTPRIYPFVDVPNHLGLATIFRHYDEPDNHFNQFYEINTVLKPNTFHIYFTSLALFPSVEFGNKIFYCLYVLLLPVSVLLTIKKFRGNPWFAMLSFLFLYNYNVSYGFVGFTIAIPFFFFLFALIPDHLQQNKFWPSLCIAALFIVIFFMHALAVLFALLVFCACTAYQKRFSCIHILKKSIAIIPIILLILYWWQKDTIQFEGPPLGPFIVDYYMHDYYQSILLRGGLFILDNYALFEGLQGYLAASIFSLFTVLIFLISIVSHKQSPQHTPNNHTTAYAVIFLLCSLACFFCIPLSLPGYGFLIQRFSVFVFLSIIILSSKLFRGEPSNLLKISLCLVALLHGICWYCYIKEFNKENISFSKEFFDGCGRDTILTGLIFDNQFRGRPIYKQCADYYIAWAQGIAATRLIDERSFALRKKTGWNGITPYIDHHQYKNINKLVGIDYILIRGDIPENIKKFFSHFKLAKSAGKWALFKYNGMPSA